MNDHVDHAATPSTHAEPAPYEYESPRIERVLTPEDMDREVMFAGPAVTVGDA
jgi:hypothetical protein